MKLAAETGDMRLSPLQLTSRRNEVGRTTLAYKQYALLTENYRSTLDNW